MNLVPNFDEVLNAENTSKPFFDNQQIKLKTIIEKLNANCANKLYCKNFPFFLYASCDLDINDLLNEYVHQLMRKLHIMGYDVSITSTKTDTDCNFTIKVDNPLIYAKKIDR